MLSAAGKLLLGAATGKDYPVTSKNNAQHDYGTPIPKHITSIPVFKPPQYGAASRRFSGLSRPADAA